LNKKPITSTAKPFSGGKSHFSLGVQLWGFLTFLFSYCK